jgi:uncharacterized protein YqeY
LALPRWFCGDNICYYQLELTNIINVEDIPKMLSEEEVRAEVEAAIAQTGASGPQEMGKVMGVLTGKLAGKADGKLIASLVKELLSR